MSDKTVTLDGILGLIEYHQKECAEAVTMELFGDCSGEIGVSVGGEFYELAAWSSREELAKLIEEM